MDSKRILSGVLSKKELAIGVLGVAVVIVAVTILKICYGSTSALLVAIRGGVVVDSQSKSFGYASPRQLVKVDFDIANTRDIDIKLVGVRMSCTCMAMEDQFPIVLKARTKQHLRVQALPPVEKTKFRQNLVLYTDYPRQREVALTVIGEVKSTNFGRSGATQEPN